LFTFINKWQAFHESAGGLNERWFLLRRGFKFCRMSRELTIACGMYAFDAALKQAWQQIFARFSPRAWEPTGCKLVC